MLSPKHINRIVILVFMGLVGFSVAKSIYSGSVLALMLAITSLAAGIYFVYLIARMNAEMDNNQEA